MYTCVCLLLVLKLVNNLKLPTDYVGSEINTNKPIHVLILAVILLKYALYKYLHLFLQKIRACLTRKKFYSSLTISLQHEL